ADRARRRHRPTRHRARGETARSGLLSPCGRTSISFDSSGQSGGYARPPFPRILGRHLTRHDDTMALARHRGATARVLQVSNLVLAAALTGHELGTLGVL